MNLVPTTSVEPAVYTLTCEGCGNVVERKRDKHGRPSLQQRFCSKKCQLKARPSYSSLQPTFNCRQCGVLVERERRADGKGYKKTGFWCSRTCRSAFVMANAQSNGAGWMDKNGYWMNRVDGVEVPEHRTVMEGVIGRKLFAEETVHHKDGNRLNNDPANLELWSSRHGKGQRVEDKVMWCLDFLADYPDVLERLGYRLVGDSIKLLRWPVDKQKGH